LEKIERSESECVMSFSPLLISLRVFTRYKHQVVPPKSQVKVRQTAGLEDLKNVELLGIDAVRGDQWAIVI
jgi:hypothetical protein